MAVLERSHRSQIITRTSLAVMLLASFLYAALMIGNASRLSASTQAVSQVVKVGPLNLLQLQKEPLAAGGYKASIGFLSGTLVYFGIWIAIAVGLTYFRLSKNSTKN